MSRVHLLAGLLFAALLVGAARADEQATGLRVGLASGALEAPPTAGATPALGRAAVFQRGPDALALVALELPLVTSALTEAVELRVKRLGLQGVALVATGETLGPGGWSRRPLDLPRLGPHQPGALDALAERIAEVLRQAHAALAPAQLTNRQTAAPELLRLRGTDTPAPTRLLHELSVAGLDDARRGRVVRWAAPLRASAAAGESSVPVRGDWPTALARRLEAAEPGTVALVLRGPAADLEFLPVPAPSVDPAAPYVAALEQALGEHMTLVGTNRPQQGVRLERLVATTPIALRAPLLDPGATPPTASTHDISLLRLTLDDETWTLFPGELTSRAVQELLPYTWNLVCNAGDHVGTLLDADSFATPLALTDDVLFGPDALRWVETTLIFDEDIAPEQWFEPVSGQDIIVGPRACHAPSLLPKDRWGFGWLHGSLRRRQTQELVAAALPQPDRALVLRARALAGRLEPRWREELLGIAHGADVAYDAVLMLNLLVQQNLEDPSETPHAPRTQATSVAALGQATSMGQPLHAVATTSSLALVLAGFTRLVVMEPPDGVPFVAPAWPGVIAVRAGMNAHGISISVEEFEGPPSDADNVTSVAFLVRDVLEQATSLEVAERMLSVPGLRTSGARFTLVDGHRLEARVVERLGADVQVRRALDGLLAGCDPDAALDCFVGACDPDVPRCDPEGPRGYPALRRALEPLHGRLRLGDLERGITLPEVCVPGTLFACIFEPQSLEARLTTNQYWPTRVGTQGWTRVALLDLLSPQAQARYALTPPVTEIGPVRVEKKPLSIGGIELSEVEFQSPAPSGFATNDRIRGVFYRPSAPRGAVIALPAWKESNLAGQGLLALALAKDGYAVLVMPLPYQVDRALEGRGSGEWTFSADLARTRAAFLQGAADVARASLWLEEQGFATRHQAVMGVSLGGHVAALAYGAYPERFGAGVFLLAGGDVSTALLTENRTTGRIRKALLERGVTSVEAVPLMQVIDGATWADPTRGAGVLVVGAKEDDVVPPANVRALAASYGGARTEWLEGDHYGILRQLPKTIAWVVDHLGKTLPPR